MHRKHHPNTLPAELASETEVTTLPDDLPRRTGAQKAHPTRPALGGRWEEPRELPGKGLRGHRKIPVKVSTSSSSDASDRSPIAQQRDASEGTAPRAEPTYPVRRGPGRQAAATQAQRRAQPARQVLDRTRSAIATQRQVFVYVNLPKHRKGTGTTWDEGQGVSVRAH